MKGELRKSTFKDKLRYYIGYPRRLFALKVVGHSMSPTINDGDVVLCDWHGNVKVGDIVFSTHPFMKSIKIVKRITQIDENGMVTLTGDNPAESTDSRTLGTIPIKSIRGQIVCKW